MEKLAGMHPALCFVDGKILLDNGFERLELLSNQRLSGEDLNRSSEAASVGHGRQDEGRMTDLEAEPGRGWGVSPGPTTVPVTFGQAARPAKEACSLGPLLSGVERREGQARKESKKIPRYQS